MMKKKLKCKDTEMALEVTLNAAGVQGISNDSLLFVSSCQLYCKQYICCFGLSVSIVSSKIYYMFYKYELIANCFNFSKIKDTHQIRRSYPSPS